MATHSSVLTWRIPGMGKPGGLLSVGSHRVGHDWSDLAAAGGFSRRAGFRSCHRPTEASWEICVLNSWGNEKWGCGVWPHLVGSCFSKGRKALERECGTEVGKINHVLQILQRVASGCLQSELWSIHNWIYHEDKKFIFPSILCNILWMCSSETNAHREKDTELVYSLLNLSRWKDLHTRFAYSAPRSGNSMLLEAPISLPITTALLCPPTQALACSFSYYMGLASSNQHCCLWAFVDLSFPLLQSIHWVKIPQFIYPFCCSWPFGYLMLCGCGI